MGFAGDIAKRVKGFLLRDISLTVEKCLLLAAATNASRVKNLTLVTSLKDVEFKVFSQWGEDGIIQFLVHQVGVPPDERVFIEFGVEDYSEANTRFLLMNDNWRGLIIDGSARNIARVRNADIHWKHDLTAVEEFITRENINDLFLRNGFAGDIGLLSIDIDGNDYWVWEAISSINPRIVICECNGIFGPEAAVTIPYDPEFRRGAAHYSNLYYGASLSALRHLATKKGYVFVGTNTVGSNAFFVLADLMNESLALLADSYEPSACSIRESRDQEGNLTYLSGDARLQIIRDQMMVDVTTGETRAVGSIVG